MTITPEVEDGRDAGRTASPTAYVRLEALVDCVTAIFEARGVGHDFAAASAEALCYADSIGRSSHGVANLRRIYLDGIATGEIDPSARPAVVSDTGSNVLLDGNKALGLAAATQALDRAVERALDTGLALVGVRNGTHFGCAGYYGERAAAQGMVAIVSTNCGSGAVVRAPGGNVAVLGTNPICIAGPVDGRAPFVLDMSTSVVATSRIREAARHGREVPSGWLEDDDGGVVVDPLAFVEGRAHVRLLGGSPDEGVYKGYGLSIAVEILCGLLTGAAVGTDDAREGRGIGHFFLVLSPAAFGTSDFAERAERMFRALVQSGTNARGTLSYPGALEHTRRAEARSAGVAMTTAVFGDLCVAARESDVPEPVASPGPLG